MQTIFRTLQAKALMALFALLFIAQAANSQCNLTMQYYQNPGTFGVNFYAGWSDSACYNPASTVTWSFGDGTSGTGYSAYHLYPAAGLYVVQYSATPPGGQSISRLDTIVVTGGTVDCNTSLSFSYVQQFGTYQVNFFNQSNLSGACFSQNTQFTWTFNITQPAPITTFGSQFTSYTFPGPGTYSVTLSANTLNNQTVIYTGQVTIQAPSMYLGGMVLANSSCANMPMRIELYGVNNNEYQFQNINGLADSCYYWFSVPTPTPGAVANQYIIQATPLTGTTYLPTYYGDFIFWQDATVIQPTTSQQGLDINLVAAASLQPGLGTVSGTIGGNGTTVTTTFNGQPMSTVFEVSQSNVLILNAQGQPVGFATVNADGSYSFPNLPEGEYLLRVDNPRIPSTNVPFSVTATGGAVVNLNATGTGINVVTSNAQQIKVAAPVVYPNPAGDAINISNAFGTVRIFDSKGQLVLESNEARSLSVANLKAGLYTIQTLDASQKVTNTRFVKK